MDKDRIEYHIDRLKRCFEGKIIITKSQVDYSIRLLDKYLPDVERMKNG